MQTRKLNFKKALLIVDVQNDFCSGGTLPVPEADKIIKNLNKYIKIFSQKKLHIFASRDWHPKKTKHFKQFGGAWPKHCVQNTEGAQFHARLKLPKETIVLSKGMDPEKESYSAFESFDDNNTPFMDLLKIFGIKELYIGGLATDYCVKASAIDALRAQFKVRLLTDAIKGVDVNPGDSEHAIKEMVDCGAKRTSLGIMSWK
jgi:nicotinamidase/pyrazinamidase